MQLVTMKILAPFCHFTFHHGTIGFSFGIHDSGMKGVREILSRRQHAPTVFFETLEILKRAILVTSGSECIVSFQGLLQFDITDTFLRLG